MIEAKTRKMMVGGINKYAKEIDTPPESIQINISFSEDQELEYYMCHNWQPKLKVDFKYILNKKIDLLGMEQISTPVLHNSLIYYTEMYSISNRDISVFIFARKEKIWLAVYNNCDNVKTVSLTEHLSNIGV